jgi:nucleoside-diphosphate-sugar epimerase
MIKMSSTILVTGANGFIGSALCSRLSDDNRVVGVDIKDGSFGNKKIDREHADLTDWDSVASICEKYSPDVIIHCAGIAHQKIGAVDSATYRRVNSEATENLAKAAAISNKNVTFIFLSSVSVYGEGSQTNPQITQNKKDVSRKEAKAQRGKRHTQIKGAKTKNNNEVNEESECQPSSDYAVSKLDAERRLTALFDEGVIHYLVILRLAPVYDREWSLNLDRRVFSPGKLAYLRFGSGSQKMSALARPNLVEFIEFLIHRLTQISAVQNNLSNLRINVCDEEDYSFNRIIEIFKESGIRLNHPVISFPLVVVWFATRIAGTLFSKKKEWIHSCYDKLAYDLVFDNRRMIRTGFNPRHSLETIFLTKTSLQNA